MDNRVSNLPKIGIRPTIDGRRDGVRESVEKKTMDMALSAKELIQKTLRHANGEPIEVIIADTTIGGLQEAAQCQRKFEREGVRVTITVTPIWCYGLEVIDQDPTTIKAIWGFNGTERPGAVFLAAALSAHAQIGLLLLVFMDRMFKKQKMIPFQRMLKQNYYNLPKLQ